MEDILSLLASGWMKMKLSSSPFASNQYPLATHQLQFTGPSDASIELCTGGGVRVEPLLLAHDPGVLN